MRERDEESLWNAIRSLEEYAALLDHHTACSANLNRVRTRLVACVWFATNQTKRVKWRDL